jgi:MFS family permease
VAKDVPEPHADVRLRDLDPRVRRIFVGFAFSALGSGLTMPFLYVYLAEVRHFPTPTVGLVFAYMGALGFVCAPPWGTLIDRIGPGPVIVIGLLVEAVSTASIGHVEHVWQAVVVATFMIAGNSGLWPASTALLTRLVSEPAREKTYGFQFMLLNAGLGLGGLISALIIDVESVASFQRLYYLDAATYLAYVAIIATLPSGTGDHRVAGDVAHPGDRVGWGVVLRDRALLRVLVFSVIAITFGYAQFETGFAAYVVDVAEVPARALGWAYAANTGVIVLGQLVMLRLIAGRRRSRTLAVAAAIWSVSWVVIAFSDWVGGITAIAAIVVGMGLFGVGETLWAPTSPAIVNGLAPEELRGRYNALQGMTWTVGSIMGPAMAGLLIGNGLAHLWAALVVGGTALAAVAFLTLGRHLTRTQDGLTELRTVAA